MAEETWHVFTHMVDHHTLVWHTHIHIIHCLHMFVNGPVAHLKWIMGASPKQIQNALIGYASRQVTDEHFMSVASHNGARLSVH